MTPAWYDLLDVDPSAGEAEIRDAWKAAIADLDPTDRRFRVYNQAAEVLLDPQRRAAYDAELAADRADEADEVDEVDEPVAAPAGRAAAPAPDPAVDEVRPRRGLRPRGGARPAVTRVSGRRLVPAWLLLGLAALTGLLAGVAVWLWQQPSDDDVADAVRGARAAAESAVGPVLSYDAADMEGSRAAAVSYLTSDYREEYEKFFGGVMEANAPNTGTKVETSLVRSSVVRGTDDERVQVFLFIDQSSTNKQSQQPTVNKYWVTVTMENVDGEWLVDGMKTV